MKNRKILIYALLISIFLVIGNVKADEKTVTKKTLGSDGGHYDKMLGTEVAYCLSGATKEAPDVGFTYSSHAETADNIRYAYIINALRSEGVTSIEGGLVDGKNIAGESIVFPSTYNNDVALFNSSGSITTNVNRLDFQKSGSNYKAEVTLSGYNFSSYGTCTLTGATGTINKTDISGNSGKITITVPQSSITADTTVTLTCTNAVQTYSTTKTYVCSQTNNGTNCSDYQELAVERTGEKKSNVTISGQIIADKKGKITIIKRFKNSYETTTKTLPGAKFRIKNSRGNTINASGIEEEGYIFTTDANGKIEVSDIEIPNDTASYKFTVEEISTLSGYVRILGETEITLSSSNNFTYSNPSNKFVNETVKVTISKTDATGKKELPGAKLSILDKDGNVLKKCVFLDDKSLIVYSDKNIGDNEVKACTWVSTKVEKILEGLPKGKYYLVEDLAPEGYTKSSEKIEIEIKEDGAVKDKIVMKNALEVPVPDTLSARSALLLAVAMFDVALGIGIITYVKKSKVEE